MEDILATTALDNTSCVTLTEWRFDDPKQRRLVGGMLIFIGLAGLVGNAVVIIAFVLSERLQNITNVFVINLAVSDFLSCMLAPFFVQNVLTEDEELLPPPVCAMVGILLYVFVSSSIVNHAVIAVNRYCSISRPVSVYRKLFSPTRIAIMLVLIWTYSSIIPLVAHLSGITKFGYNSKYRICSLDVIEKNARTVSFVRVLAVDVVCLIVVVIFYVKFFLFIKRHSNQLMHIYSYDRRGSENSSNISSATKRDSDSSSHVGGITRQTSTVTRIVDIDAPGGVETILSKSKCRQVWRPMGRSVSQTVMTPTEAFNNHTMADVISEEDEIKYTEEVDGHVNKIETDDVEEEGESDSSKKMSECSEVLSAIDETAEDIGDIENEKKAENRVDLCAESRETETHASEDDVKHDVERDSSVSDSHVEIKQTPTPEITAENTSCNNHISDDLCHSSSTDDSTTEHDSNDDEESAPNGAASNGARYHQDRNATSGGSPTHSAIAIQRRRFSELLHRSFFGRSSSVSSQSERVRCMQVRLNKRQVQITKNLFVVVCAFVFCVSQYSVFLVIPSLERLLPYSAVLITVSHAINPIIYAIKHPTFKVVIRPMLMCKLSKIPGPSRALKAILRK